MPNEERVPSIWRMKLRTALGEEFWPAHVDYCVKGKVAGLGYPLPGTRAGASLESVLTKVGRRKDWGHRGQRLIERFALEMEVGDFIWTRDLSGRFLLGQVNGEWSYVGNGARENAADVHQVRSVKAWRSGSENELSAPGAVVASFAGRGNALQRINNEAVRRATPYLWDWFGSKAPGDRKSLPIRKSEVLTSFIDPRGLEDLVYAWLQAEQDYIVLPGHHTRSQPVYESICTHRRRRPGTKGQLAVAQVKSAGSRIVLRELLEASPEYADVYVYIPGIQRDDRSGAYIGSAAELKKVKVIEDRLLLDFASRKPHLLPESIRAMFELAS